MNDEMPSWAALLIGGGVGLLLIGVLLTAIRGVENVRRKKDAKRQANDEDQISFDLPSGGYDSTGRLFPTELETQVAIDEAETHQAQITENLQKRIDAKRKRRGEKTRHGVRPRISEQ